MEVKELLKQGSSFQLLCMAVALADLASSCIVHYVICDTPNAAGPGSGPLELSSAPTQQPEWLSGVGCIQAVGTGADGQTACQPSAALLTADPAKLQCF